MPIIHFLHRVLSKVASLCGGLATLTMILLLLNVFYDVVMRYAFNDVSIGMQELEWHLFAATFLLGIPYTLQRDAHVRVDIFYEGWSDPVKAWINLLGALLLVLPFCCLIVYFGVDFAVEAYSINEGSGDPGGLPYRWLIKSLIPLAMGLSALASLTLVTQALMVIVGKEPYPKVKTEPLS